jgi:NTP pyrophosphatase (non-canonical NTP hydrolase)
MGKEGRIVVQGEEIRRMKDRLAEMFERQRAVQERFSKIDSAIHWPPETLDITSKQGQRQLRDIGFRMVEEMMEAFRHFKNKPHSQRDVKEVDVAELKEEIADTFTYFLNLCIFVGMNENDLYYEYVKKNDKNNKRIDERY